MPPLSVKRPPMVADDRPYVPLWAASGIVMAGWARAVMVWSSGGVTRLIELGIIGIVFIALSARGRRNV